MRAFWNLLSPLPASFFAHAGRVVDDEAQVRRVSRPPECSANRTAPFGITAASPSIKPASFATRARIARRDIDQIGARACWRTPSARRAPQAQGRRRAKHASAKDSAERSRGGFRVMVRPCLDLASAARVPARDSHVGRLLRGFDALLAVVGAVALLALLLGISADSRARSWAGGADAGWRPQAQVAETGARRRA